MGPAQRKYAKMMRGNPTGLKQKLALRHSHLVKCNAVPIHYFLLVPKHENLEPSVINLNCAGRATWATWVEWGWQNLVSYTKPCQR